ncbi:MAG: TonB-dependent receptor [Flavobacteriales bacterium]
MSKRLFILLFYTVKGVFFIKAQEKIDSIETIQAVTIEVDKPITAKTLHKRELNQKNLGQDLPFLLKNTPSVVTTSDAGAGIGYTGMRLRGSDPTRINVTVNGIPLNDSESQGVFWVNMPDFASSTHSIVIQRGLGTSTNGSASFGGSINIGSLESSDKKFAELNTSYGSFNSQKINLKLGTGNIGDFNIDGRISFINSEGYIDRSNSNLLGYSFKAGYKNRLKFLAFGGHEKTYQAWNGIDQKTLESNRTYNTAGEIYNDSGILVGYYDNEVDDYQQNHYQLHYNFDLAGWKSHAALHYTRGNGFFENYKNNESYSFYNLSSTDKGDVIRQKWLQNHFYGMTFNTKKKLGDLEVIIGAHTNRYEGDHFGLAIATPGRTDIKLGSEYYSNKAFKNEISGYIKAEWNTILENIVVFGDLQIRNITYKADTKFAKNKEDEVDFSDNLTFFNPKLGWSWNLGRAKVYGYYGFGHREPSRNDYENNPNIKPEKMHNIELGYRKGHSKLHYTINGYFMYYQDQLVLTGTLDEVGAPIRENSGESYRLGVELETHYALSSKWQLGGNATFSKNQNRNYFKTDYHGNPIFLRNTTISYSPEIIANGFIQHKPIPGLLLNLTGKYVGEQFMTNQNILESKLEDYFTTDLLLQYQIPLNSNHPQVEISLLINNILDHQYENNGYYYNYYISEDELSHNPYYYPQAGIHFLAGLSIRF